jgi:hypothetical protein
MSYPKLILEERINGMNVNLVGVSHTRDFFHEHEDFFRDQIVNAPAVFLEDGPKGFTYEFDEEIAKVAQETEKAIYIPEPSNGVHVLLDIAQLGVGGYFAGSYLRKPKEISRRSFLKKGGATLLGLYLAWGSFMPRGFVQKAIGDENVKIDDALQYGTVEDYRNIVVAENLDRASKRVQLEGSVPYFIGSDHVEGIHTYINNPELRRKRIVYLPQDLISDTSFRKYEFLEGKWKLTEKI